MSRALRVALVAAAATACTNIASPARSSVYEYGFPVAPGDTLRFHWPAEFLPVRIWAPDTGSMKGYVNTAIERWQHAFLYGEYRATLVADSTQADVIVLNQFPPDVDNGLPAMAPQCTGLTNFAPSATDPHVLVLPFHVYVYQTVLTASAADVAKCFSITMTHELGHTLGILNHSPFATDVMFANPVVDAISTNDRETAETVYHLPGNVTVTGRR